MENQSLKLRGLLAGISLMMFSSLVAATQVQVRVVDPNTHNPVSNAAVCLGTPAQLDQFGAQRTDYRGLVSFELAGKVPALITVSANQYKGVQRAIAVDQTDILREISLPRGGLGPSCSADPGAVEIKPAATKTPRLRLADLQINRGENMTYSRSVVIAPHIQGSATHYRVSENRDFSDSPWQNFQKTPLVMLSEGNGKKRLYYQVREVFQSEKGTIERVSNVMSDTITLKSR